MKKKDACEKVAYGTWVEAMYALLHHDLVGHLDDLHGSVFYCSRHKAYHITGNTKIVRRSERH
jgi:hypothetical protein